VESPVNPADSLNPGTRFTFSLPMHITGPAMQNEDVERRFWKLQNEGARKNRPLIVFTELAVDDLLTTSSLSNYKMTLASDRDRIDYQILALQPNALIEITAGQGSLLSDMTRRLLEQENIPYLHCQVHQEDTGVDPQWDAYLVKPFSMDQVTEIVEEISPGAAHFMVVDDDENMLRFFQLGLRSLGTSPIRLTQASTGQDARALLDQEIPDVLFLDINLPDADGLELLHEIRQQGRSRALPVIIISARNKPFLYQTQVEQIEYQPGQALDKETFLYEIEGFLDSIRLNSRS
jgi:CheY-like chemotaxis protein